MVTRIAFDSSSRTVVRRVLRFAAFLALASCGGGSDPAGPPASGAAAVAATGPTTGTGIINRTAPITPAVRVTDASGNPLQNISVSVTVTGGGNVSVPSPVTNGSGVASVGSWTLGSTLGGQSVTMRVTGLTPVVFTVTAGAPYTVDIRFIGSGATPAVQAAFNAAAARIQQVITASLTPISQSVNAADFCQNPALPTLNEVIPNIIIFAEISNIDGPGKILAQSGPCGLRSSNNLPFLGVMRFDDTDLQPLINNGSLTSVVLHEMHHALGFGTLWFGPPDYPIALVTGINTASPIYVGANARTEYVAAGGTAPTGVPVEGGTTAGTSNSHWRETVFQSELMTGILTGQTQPLSRITIGALADLGYTVNYAAGDSYTVPPPGALRLGPPVATEPFGERLILPRYKIDDRGRTIVIPR